jgi:hypothetical protein
MSKEEALNSTAARLGVPPDSLNKLIAFESAWNPLAKNPISGARGLIQFTHKTAQGLGFLNADDLVNKYPTVESQLAGPVLSYLSKYKPFGNPFPQSLYLSVFYPAYRFSSLNTEFSDTVKKQNPGIKYVGDYIAKVEKKTFKKYGIMGFVVPILAATLAVFYKQYKRRIEHAKGKGIE